MNKKEKIIKVCPKCGSTDFSVTGGVFGIHFTCKNCGESMQDFPIVEESKLKDLQKHLKSKKKSSRF